MQQLENKVPPPIVLIVCIFIIWLLAEMDSARVLSVVPIWLNSVLGIGLALLGVLIAAAGVKQFKKARTTVNPLDPSKASSMVVSGVFAITRNPMYLGMAFVALGAVVFLGSALSIVGLILFIGFITRFQIIPEERALKAIFGEEFETYIRRTRRWF